MAETTSFHWRDNWWFCRGVDGVVIVEHWNENSAKDAGRPADICLEIPSGEWTSIIASVSEGGESTVYTDAWDLHMNSGKVSQSD